MELKKFLPGDELTLEDVRESLRIIEERCYSRSINENNDVKFEIKDGCGIFESWEDMEKYYGGLYTIDEVFKW